MVGTVDGESDKTDGCDDTDGNPDGCIETDGTEDGAPLGSREGRIEGDWLGFALTLGKVDGMLLGKVDGMLLGNVEGA